MSKCRLCGDTFNSGIIHLLVHVFRKLDEKKVVEKPCKRCGNITVLKDDKDEPECIICYKASQKLREVAEN